MAKGIKAALDAVREKEEAKCVILSLAGIEDGKYLISVIESEAEDKVAALWAVAQGLRQGLNLAECSNIHEIRSVLAVMNLAKVLGIK